MTIESLEQAIEEARSLADRSRNQRLKGLLRGIADDLEDLVEEARRVTPQNDKS